MIQRMEIWDFESHEHTVLEDISPALNLLVGDSQAGKSSIIRALKLAAYNDFDPRSVRIGATKCVVEVTTERGVVKVTRGPKHNLWEVTRKGQKTQYFDKVGTNIVPEAAEVIGLNIITLGDVQVPVNIMDQLESHFMLAGVGDKDATGSMRAQIVDEISGLSGIEGLIKDVSLDRHRFGRDITETEKKMEETRDQLYPEADLMKEATVLDDAEKELTAHDEMTVLAQEGCGVVSDWDAKCRQIDDLEFHINEIPDTDIVIADLARSSLMLDDAGEAEKLLGDGFEASRRESAILGILANMPDERYAIGLLSDTEIRIRTLGMATDLLSEWNRVDYDVADNERRMDKLELVGHSDAEIETAIKTLSICEGADKALMMAQRLMASIMGMKERIVDCEKELKKAEKHRDDLLASIKTCPLTLRPVTKECMEGLTE